MSHIDVGAIDEFPCERFRVVRVEGREIGILRTGNGTIHAVRNWCPHRGAPICQGTLGGTMRPSAPGRLEFADDALVLRCPWHLLEFDMGTGEAMYGTSRRRLAVYDAKVRAGRVVVDATWARAAA